MAVLLLCICFLLWNGCLEYEGQWMLKEIALVVFMDGQSQISEGGMMAGVTILLVLFCVLVIDN